MVRVVINIVEEYGNDTYPKSLSDVAKNPLVVGIWTWSRGGGWGGPSITHEMWIDLNVYVISHWARNTSAQELDLFNDYVTLHLGLPRSFYSSGSESTSSSSASIALQKFRTLVLKATSGVLHGHYVSGKAAELTGGPMTALQWTRDYYIGGNDKDLLFNLSIQWHFRLRVRTW
jgi:hypothetical protein